MHFGPRQDLSRATALATTLFLVICGQAIAASSSSQVNEIPDLSGVWARGSIEFEPPPSGPGPIANKSRLPSGVSDLNKIVGDYDNPILKPHAADIVKRLGEISLSGKSFLTP